MTGKAKKVEKLYPEKASFIEKKLNMLSIVEQAKNTPIDKVAKLFGEIMAEVFVYKDDFWKEDKLIKQLSMMKKKKAVLCSAGRELMTPKGEKTGKIMERASV